MPDRSTLIPDLLAALGRSAGDLIRQEPLLDGASGSFVYLLTFPGEQVVLKATPADSPPYMLERSQRELSFLETLAGQITLRTPRLLAGQRDASGGVALLLAVYRNPPPQDAWQRNTYVAL